MLFNQIQNLFVITTVNIIFEFLGADSNSSSVADYCSKALIYLGGLE
tara:strand:- start:716 stop:856 length:141 start_codon:yes stop_codon:yes gene_type:complete